ncbi:MAG: putative Cytosolic Protein [Conexibacter sp.]|nr:putative Cytosolic Protein [Conexibacter sp.]
MPQVDPSRSVAALIALAAGDALGWPMEDRGGRVGGTASVSARYQFEDWARREGGGYSPHVQPVKAGEVSDDTQLAVAVARSLLRGDDWWQHLTTVELPLWTVYERGGGGATKRAARSWLQGREPWADERRDAAAKYFAAGGNGTAMRCLPHCLLPTEDFSTLARRLDLDASATHGHPYALLGSRLYGWAANWAITRVEPLGYGELLTRALDDLPRWAHQPDLSSDWLERANRHMDFAECWDAAVRETSELIDTGLRGIRRGAVAVDSAVLDEMGVFGASKGAGHITAAASLFLASRYATQPEQGLLTAAYARGADTDTLAAMTGGLLGVLAGETWLRPLVRKVQDVDYLARLAFDLTEGAHADASPPFRVRDRTKLYRALEQAERGAAVHVPSLGHCEIVDIEDFDARTQFIRAWTLRSSTGQTLYIKRYDKGDKKGEPRWLPLATSIASAAEEPEPEPPAGLVLPVSDLDRSREFYETVVGLHVRRATERYISFGWLALERGSDQQRLATGPDADQLAIRVYLSPGAVERAERYLAEHSVSRAAVVRDGKRVVRSTDPDGHPVDFYVRNGAPPPVT